MSRYRHFTSAPSTPTSLHAPGTQGSARTQIRVACREAEIVLACSPAKASARGRIPISYRKMAWHSSPHALTCWRAPGHPSRSPRGWHVGKPITVNEAKTSPSISAFMGGIADSTCPSFSTRVEGQIHVSGVPKPTRSFHRIDDSSRGQCIPRLLTEGRILNGPRGFLVVPPIQLSHCPERRPNAVPETSTASRQMKHQAH